MVAWLYRDRIRVSGPLALALFAVLCTTLQVAPVWFTLVAIATVPYLTLYLAARLPFREFERRGDLSYGMYLYGFPVQQLLVTAGAAPLGPLPLALLSVAATAPFAAASWVLVERPMLQFKNARLGGLLVWPRRMGKNAS
jgi:peptidoglycan/LPS O-acetylase OafA/YrhL